MNSRDETRGPDRGVIKCPVDIFSEGASWRDGQLRRIISFGITPFGRDPLGETTPTKGITPFGRDPLGETTPAKGITPFGRDP